MTAGSEHPEWWVVCLCAAWCGVCRDWRPLFEAQARAHPHMQFAWVDVEDEAAAMGDYEVETFPSLLVARGAEPLFLGPLPPSGAQIARLLATLQAQPQALPGLDPAAGALVRSLAPEVLGRSTV